MATCDTCHWSEAYPDGPCPCALANLRGGYLPLQGVDTERSGTSHKVEEAADEERLCPECRKLASLLPIHPPPYSEDLRDFLRALGVDPDETKSEKHNG